MNIKVKFFTSLREITGKKIDEIQVPKKITLKELIILLSEKYGKNFKEYIYDKNGEVKGFLSFLLNGKNINILQGFNIKLNENDIIAILPPVGGG